MDRENFVNFPPLQFLPIHSEYAFFLKDNSICISINGLCNHKSVFITPIIYLLMYEEPPGENNTNCHCHATVHRRTLKCAVIYCTVYLCNDSDKMRFGFLIVQRFLRLDANDSTVSVNGKQTGLCILQHRSTIKAGFKKKKEI